MERWPAGNEIPQAFGIRGALTDRGGSGLRSVVRQPDERKAIGEATPGGILTPFGMLPAVGLRARSGAAD